MSWTTRYVTRYITSTVLDPRTMKATRYISRVITAYVTPPPSVSNIVITKRSLVVTRLATQVYIDGKLYTTIYKPTRILSTVIAYTSVVPGPLHPPGQGKHSNPVEQPGYPNPNLPGRRRRHVYVR